MVKWLHDNRPEVRAPLLSCGPSWFFQLWTHFSYVTISGVARGFHVWRAAFACSGIGNFRLASTSQHARSMRCHEASPCPPLSNCPRISLKPISLNHQPRVERTKPDLSVSIFFLMEIYSMNFDANHLSCSPFEIWAPRGQTGLSLRNTVPRRSGRMKCLACRILPYKRSMMHNLTRCRGKLREPRTTLD